MNFDNDVEIKKRALKLCEYYESWGLDCIEQYDKEVKSLNEQEIIILMNTIKILNNKYFDWFFMLFGILLQVVCFILTGDSILSFICGLSGVINVVLCSQRKLSFYLFAYIQMFTYIIIIFQQHLYGELIENIFYVITTTIALFIWIKNYNKEEKQVEAKKLTKKQLIIYCIVFIISTILLYTILLMTNDPKPFLDSISTVPAFIAQFLLMFRYREQWIMWLIVDIATLILWISIGNIFMIMQYIFWILNCIYGFVKWSK